MRRSAAALLLLAIVGCTDLGEVKRPPHEGKRATLDENLETLLAVPMKIRCERAILALSPEYRRELRVAGTGLVHQKSGGAVGEGRIRLVFRTLQIDCKRLALSVHADKLAYLQLMAADKVQVERVETRFTANLLLIEDGRMTYAGDPKMKIQWELPGTTGKGLKERK